MNQNFQFIQAKDKNDLKRFYPIMKELRPHLSFDDYILAYNEAHKRDEYEIVAIEAGRKIPGRSLRVIS